MQRPTFSKFLKYLSNKWAWIGIIFVCSVAYATWFPTLRVDGAATIGGTLGVTGQSTFEGTAITSTNWGHVAAMDQDVGNGDTVTFGTVNGTIGTASQPNITGLGTLTALVVDDPIEQTHQTTPSNPPSGSNKLYFKADGNLYKLDSGGSETQVDAALGAVNLQTSSSSGAFSTTSTTFVDVTNMSITITTTGRPVVLMIRPHVDGVSPTGNRLECVDSVGATAACQLRWVRDAAQIHGQFEIRGDFPGNNVSIQVPISALIVDQPTAGTYTYKLQGLVGSGDVLRVRHFQVIAYEL